MQTPSKDTPYFVANQDGDVLTEEEFRDLPVERLFELQEAAKRDLAQAKELAFTVNAAIYRRFMFAAEAAYKSVSKEHGTVRLPQADGYQVKVDISRGIVWDQAGLKEIAKNMNWETIQHYFKIKFEVPSKIYDGIPPGDNLKAEFMAARTVKFGAPKVVIEAPKEPGNGYGQ